MCECSTNRGENVPELRANGRFEEMKWIFSPRQFVSTTGVMRAPVRAHIGFYRPWWVDRSAKSACSSMPKKRHFAVENRHFGLDNPPGSRMYIPIGNTFPIGGHVVPKFNTQFELSVSDMDLIEDALRASKMAKTQADVKARAEDDEVRQIHDLLGRLHNQKTFYRPSKGPYVGG